MHGYKWPINCTRTRTAELANASKQQSGRTWHTGDGAADAADFVSAGRAASPKQIYQYLDSQRSVAEEREMKRQVEDDAAAAAGQDTGAFPYNP